VVAERGRGHGDAADGDRQDDERRSRQPATVQGPHGQRGRSCLAAARAEYRVEDRAPEPECRAHGEQQTQGAPLDAQLVTELLAAGAIAQVAAQRGVTPHAPAKDGELLTDLFTRRLASGAAGDQRGAGLEHERLHLRRRAHEDLRDLLVRDVAELSEHERGALIVRESRDVGQGDAQVLSGCQLCRQMVGGQLGDLRDGMLAACAQHGEAAVPGYGIEPRTQARRRLAAQEVAVGSEERELYGVLGLLARAEHVAAEGEHRAVIAVEQSLERSLGPALHVLDQTLIGGEAQQRGRQEVVTVGLDDGGLHAAEHPNGGRGPPTRKDGVVAICPTSW
jgi:hypothetical protein